MLDLLRLKTASLVPAGIDISGSLREVPIVTPAATFGLFTITFDIAGTLGSLVDSVKPILAVTPAVLLRPYVRPKRSPVASFLESEMLTLILSAADS